MKKFLCLILMCNFLSLFSAVAAEMWYAEYDAGLDAIAKKNWSLAETKLINALKLQPKQGRKVFAYGIRFMRYFPKYYLGVVHFQQGKYEASLSEFRQMQSTGLIVAEDPEYSEMMKLVRLADEKINLKVTAQPEILPSTQFRQDPPPVESLQDENVQKQVDEQQIKNEQFEMLIQNANTALSAKNFKQANDFANQATTMQVHEAKIRDLLQRIQNAEKMDALENTISERDWPDAQKLLQQLMIMDRTNQQLIAMKSDIELGLKFDELEDRALLAFLEGEYHQAATLFADAISLRRDFAEAWFYLACSHAAEGLLQGKNGEELLQKAQQEFSEVRKLNPNLKYDPALISPRIVELYNLQK